MVPFICRSLPWPFGVGGPSSGPSGSTSGNTSESGGQSLEDPLGRLQHAVCRFARWPRSPRGLIIGIVVLLLEVDVILNVLRVRRLLRLCPLSLEHVTPLASGTKHTLLVRGGASRSGQARVH